jgi:hypothetical protein
LPNAQPEDRKLGHNHETIKGRQSWTATRFSEKSETKRNHSSIRGTLAGKDGSAN